MAGPGNNMSSVSGLLKRWYRDGGVVLTTFRDRPYWAMVTKKADSSTVEGSTFQFAIKTNDMQSRNTLFNAAMSQARGLAGFGGVSALTNTTAAPATTGSIGVTQFTVPRVMNFTYANISTELVLASRTKRGAFDEAVTSITDSALNVLGNDQEISMFGGSITSAGITTSSSGFLSTIVSPTVVSTATPITLQYPFDVNKFSVGQELDVYFNNSGVITKRTNAGGTGLFVGVVDRTLGQITIVNASGTVIAPNTVFTNMAVGDFLCVTNDFNQGASTGPSGGGGTGKILGFESWVPFGGPVGDSSSNLFNGINRNVGDVTRLAGNWIDATGASGPNTGTTLNIEDALITATQIAAMQSSKNLDTFAYNFNQHTKLLKANVARTMVEINTSIPGLSFKGMEVMTATGPVECIPDRFCGTNRIYGLHMDSWEYIHLGDPVEMWALDGNDALREPDLDALSYRLFSLGNLCCTEPNANVTINIAP